MFIGNGKMVEGGGKGGVLGKGSGCHRFTDVRKGDDFGRILIPDIHD